MFSNCFFNLQLYLKSALLPALLILSTSSQAGDEADCDEGTTTQCEQATSSDARPMATLGGPEQVENRLYIDFNQVTPMFPSDFARGYFDWKARVKKDHGVTLGGDYSAVYLSASDSQGEDSAFGGMYRLFGSWEVTADGKGNSGALIWKAEHRHAYGSNVPPGSFGFETGYIGLYEPPFSDQGTRLTNLYWRQRMRGGDLVFVGGFIDVTDYMDVYMLSSPWTGFFNFAFSTGAATIPAPNEGLALGLGGYLSENFYIIGGFADSNSIPPSRAMVSKRFLKTASTSSISSLVGMNPGKRLF